MTSLFTNLREHLEITPLNDDQVKVSLVLPSDILVDFIQVLDSLTGLAVTIRSKTRLAKYSDTSEDSLASKQRDQFYQRIVSLYDIYTDQGLKRTAAIKRISSDLRKEKHPWQSVDLVRAALDDAGRPWRKSK